MLGIGNVSFSDYFMFVGDGCVGLFWCVDSVFVGIWLGWVVGMSCGGYGGGFVVFWYCYFVVVLLFCL